MTIRKAKAKKAAPGKVEPKPPGKLDMVVESLVLQPKASVDQLQERISETYGETISKSTISTARGDALRVIRTLVREKIIPAAKNKWG